MDNGTVKLRDLKKSIIGYAEKIVRDIAYSEASGSGSVVIKYEKDKITDIIIETLFEMKVSHK